MTKPRLVALSFNVYGTGFTRVMHSILRPLAGGFDIHYVGLGYQGPVVRDGLTIYPTNLEGGDVFGAFQAAALVEELQPAVIFILHDIWHMENYMRRLAPVKGAGKIVTYLPLDGRVTDETLAAPLRLADRVVVFTAFAQRELEGAFARLRQGDAAASFPPVEVVPHGVDLTAFYPFPELHEGGFDEGHRRRAKRQVFPDLEVEGSFVVLNASRPARRKRIDLTMAGFTRFARGKPQNVRLCLHHALMGERERAELAALTVQHQLEDRLHLNPLNPAGGPLSDADLNLLYNACDVGINTAMGEGWGLVSFEHAAAGAAQVVPHHSACAVLWEGAAALIEPARHYIPPFSLLEMAEVTPEAVAETLEHLYQDRRRLRTLAAAGYRSATRPAYRWPVVAQQWGRIFEELAREARRDVQAKT